MDIAMRAGEASAVVVHATWCWNPTTASQPPADKHLAISVNPKHPKNRVRYFRTDCPNCLHDWLF